MFKHGFNHVKADCHRQEFILYFSTFKHCEFQKGNNQKMKSNVSVLDASRTG